MTSSSGLETRRGLQQRAAPHSSVTCGVCRMCHSSSDSGGEPAVPGRPVARAASGGSCTPSLGTWRTAPAPAAGREERSELTAGGAKPDVCAHPVCPHCWAARWGAGLPPLLLKGSGEMCHEGSFLPDSEVLSSGHSPGIPRAVASPWVFACSFCPFGDPVRGVAARGQHGASGS